MVIGVFFGCATSPTVISSSLKLTLEEPGPPNNPLIAITPDILTLAAANNADITDLHYYVSTAIVLELARDAGFISSSW
jgi:hypothetical protein